MRHYAGDREAAVVSERTPIAAFVRRYADEGAVRLHMPGHKGRGEMASHDITEIPGADSLYEADGIIRESERLTGELFGAYTLYSTEGSSLCIRAMLYLAKLQARRSAEPCRILAGRQAHKTFIGAAALLDIEVDWLYPSEDDGYLRCTVTAETVNDYLQNCDKKPTAIYLTSPDYLGGRTDISSIARVCHAHGVLLLVDNAHGAYLRFLPTSCHPISLGADLCCDSAHKTLPCLTGGAYLHIQKGREDLYEHAREALALFGSTSPSYLILSSLDTTQAALADGYGAAIAALAARAEAAKEELLVHGYTLVGDEPLKITLKTKPYGYTGDALCASLRQAGFVCEFSDPDFVVMMLTPSLGEDVLPRLLEVLCTIPRRAPIDAPPPRFCRPQRRMSAREALLSLHEILPVSAALGRTLGAVTVGCPPAVPILTMGEVVDAHAVEVFRYYGIPTVTVVKDV